jgi:D-beta-D-heptose 7-phosphate kinase/D-beta-D-heptose 1-phosphate adenosyltransferase
VTATRAIKTKILSPTALAKKLAGLKRGKKKPKVVFTNGCFDLLHPGHVTYLERARALGDILVMGVNSDASVSRIKGPSRPVNKLKDRLTVLAALESVDFVTWFGTETPLALIRKLHPDVLVKGGDWKPADIVGSADVLSWGGTVRSLAFLKGRSTTGILKKLGVE